jgi:Asp-tRNA(Asn)/Glu-tRNA(Gln) amidotransferase A subunit family amidase
MLESNSLIAAIDLPEGKAPGSVQIVGWRFEDEEVLAATEAVAEALS